MIEKQTSEEAANQFAEKAARISAALENYRPSGPFSVASMAVEVKGKIRLAIGRGAKYRDVAAIFRAEGIDASPDAIRRAIDRNITTKAARARKLSPPISHVEESSVSTNREAESPKRFSQNGRSGPNLAERLK